MITKDEWDHGVLARNMTSVSQRLASAKVLIAGLGGLGSNIAVMLTRIGIGRLRLVDFDVVELSNLNRQHYFLAHLGMPKTDALRAQLLAINPHLDVETRQLRITEDNAGALAAGCDLVCEAFDQPDAKAMLVTTVLAQVPDVPIVSGSGMAGYFSSNLVRTERPLRRLYVSGDRVNEPVDGRGLMAPRVLVCAAHQANMIVRLLMGEHDA
ncbi:MAG TPA: sulfur carrier protein ThiS adenylyltransferase ThiF [Propionicimonas sp.]|jgi:sulfur carrier protein ThiS adenylyltransferase